MSAHDSAATIRAKLNHPIFDADGHWLEFPPAMQERMRRVGGERAAMGFADSQKRFGASLNASVEERRKNRVPQEAFWSSPNDPTDRATVMMPKLLYQRLDELGIDFAVIYPTAGLPIVRIMDPELRRATCRAYNVIVAEQFGPYADRMCPAAIIPMYTPDEAIEEIEYVTRQLGQKRNAQGLQRTEPGRIDGGLMLRIAEAHASGELLQKIREVNGRIDSDAENRATGGIANLDDFSACKIEQPEDFLQLFAGSFYFGCEADDHANAWAFNRKVNPLGAGPNAMFGSDIGYFDVPDITQVVPEAYELLEHGLLDEEAFRDFTFANAVRVWGTHNPTFFKGTVIECAAADVLAA
ncbi:MAG: hypothetical protein ACKVQU_21940 [Burkholderiales bacterium]